MNKVYNKCWICYMQQNTYEETKFCLYKHIFTKTRKWHITGYKRNLLQKILFQIPYHQQNYGERPWKKQ